MRCRIAPGEMVSCWVLRVVLYGGGGGGVVFRGPSLRIVVEGVKGDGLVVFPAVERKEGVEAVPGVPGRAGVGHGCRFQEGVRSAVSGVFQEKVVFWAQLVVAPFRLSPPLEGRVISWVSRRTHSEYCAASIGWVRVLASVA